MFRFSDLEEKKRLVLLAADAFGPVSAMEMAIQE